MDKNHQADSEDRIVNTTTAKHFNELLNVRFSRRSVLQGGMGLATLVSVGGLSACSKISASKTAVLRAQDSFAFTELTRTVFRTHRVATGYEAEILLRWGDGIFPDSPPFDPLNQLAESQEKQFGYNNDFLALFEIPAEHSLATHGETHILCVNHEYTNPELMFPDIDHLAVKKGDGRSLKYSHIDILMNAHGCSVVGLRLEEGRRWHVVKDSSFNRRITPKTTSMCLSGAVAGHKRVQTKADPAGNTVIGTLNNCAGGITPWGTYLTAEENFNIYFGGDLANIYQSHPEAENYKRLGIPYTDGYNWGDYVPRFNINREPLEANRFGYIVEIDPFDPTSTPIKRTSLGRFKHEGCTVVLAKDNHPVCYSGDDQRFECLYRFVSSIPFDAHNPKASRDCLDVGTLYAAKFHEDGRLGWLPLVYGQGGLTAENGFPSQADICIDTRRAADFVGATPLDRPEDIEVNPKTGKVYIMLTNNSKRTLDQVSAISPRAENIWGHILEITPDGGDHGSDTATWDILVRGGDPSNPVTAAVFHPETTANGWFSCPDNAAFDADGRLWVATDQGDNWKEASGSSDGLFALETEGVKRGKSKLFFQVPVGAELCSPLFDKDNTSLFLSVQHPAADGSEDYTISGQPSTFLDPATRWPDFKAAMPPRPSVVVVQKQGGGKIGG